VKYGAHLPLIDAGGGTPTLAGLRSYAEAAATSGFEFLCANDHLLFARPWLDGPTALAAVIAESGEMKLATTIGLPVIRGPIQLAKTLAALDVLSDGRLVAGVGPGSSQRDYDAIGIAFDERWQRFDEAVRALRALLSADTASVSGTFYTTDGIVLEPSPVRPEGPRIWIASWGSAAGLRRVERLADGWLASAYNTTPAAFAGRLGALPAGFPNAVATTWTFITERRAEAEGMLRDVLAPMLGRPLEQIRDLALLIGSAEQCAERLAAWAEAGVQHLFIWPLRDELRQLELFSTTVGPRVVQA
jgi:alkanesulfonate monooxygenase SsuD/methylene tetrahydromethanopterin reductase-like flavin-dependent oxidoreductase (luciferase family)